jgi:hypothetical protein
MSNKAVDIALECSNQLNVIKNDKHEIKIKVNKMPPIIEKKPTKKNVIVTSKKEIDNVLDMLDNF